MANGTQSLPQVVGRNARRIRGTHTLENVATYARNLGANWSSGSVSTIELGRSKCTIETLAILSLALNAITQLEGGNQESVTIADLLETDEEILITTDYALTSAQLLDWLGGKDPETAFFSMEKLKQGLDGHRDFLKSLNLPPTNARFFTLHSRDMPETPGEGRLAKKAGIDVEELRAWSFHLWEKSFENHRDEIAGAESTPQKKGRVSRELLQEIETAMKENHGDD